MITVRTSPAYVNRVRQDWTANGGVYGDGGVYAVVPSNDPFAQLGPTLDLTFAGVPTNQLTAATADGYSINLNLSSEIYQIAAQYTVWTATGLTQVNFADIVTFTRTGSTATYFNSAGVLTTAAADVPRFDFDPSTLAAQGLLIEEQRTNSIRNNTMQGAVAGTPGTLPQVSGSPTWSASLAGGLSREIVGVSSINGINYIDIRVFGTTTNTNLALNLSYETATQIAAVAGQTWSESVWVQMVGGSTSGISEARVAMTERTSGGVDLAYLTGGNFISTISSFTRRTHTATTGNASTAFITPGLWVYSTGIGAVIDFTLRIGLPQLELGAFATSVIPTTTTALTRNRDEASVNTLSPWYNSAAGTLFNEVMLYALPPSGTFPTYSDINDGTTNNRVALSSNGFANNRVTARNTGGVLIDTNAGGSIAVNVSSKWALAYANGDYAGSANGGAVVTSPTAGLPSGLNQMTIGRAAGANQANGWLRRIVYYPRRLSNADLQTITA